MADQSLMSIISGINPLSPQMLEAYQGSQLSNAALDPAFGHNEGLAGALAKMMAGFTGPGMMQRGVQATTEGNQAAMPDLAKLLASADPYTMAAGNTAGFNPVALSRLFQGATPGTVAESRKTAAEAALAGLNVKGFQNMTPVAAAGAVPAGKNAGAALGGGTAPPVMPPTSGVTTLRPGGDLDLEAFSAMPRDQAVAAWNKLTPAQKLAYRAKLNARLGPPGGGNALRPPT